MVRDKNVGGTERAVRAIMAIVLVVAAIRAFRGGRRGRGITAGLTSAELLYTVVTGYCPGNALVGRDSTGGVETDIDLGGDDEGGAEPTAAEGIA